ncbi:MAG: pyruvate oxidoreductase [Gracilibacteraceae bacterium]|nr:pyruvate oxidoreductase [Gracilibacteraceae bacterium]
MTEIRFWGRYGQPVGQIVRTLGEALLAEGRHVQAFGSFGAFRNDAPMYAVLRVAATVVRERSAPDSTSDAAMVLDNSLFSVMDVTGGLRRGGTVLALGVKQDILGEKANMFKFIQLELDPRRPGWEGDLLQTLKTRGII